MSIFLWLRRNIHTEFYVLKLIAKVFFFYFYWKICSNFVILLYVYQKLEYSINSNNRIHTIPCANSIKAVNELNYIHVQSRVICSKESKTLMFDFMFVVLFLVITVFICIALSLFFHRKCSSNFKTLNEWHFVFACSFQVRIHK